MGSQRRKGMAWNEFEVLFIAGLDVVFVDHL